MGFGEGGRELVGHGMRPGVHMRDAVKGDRVDSPESSWKGSQGLGGGGPPVAGRGPAWALAGGLAARPGVGPVGVEPQACPAG